MTTQIVPLLSSFAPFGLNERICPHAPSLRVRHFQAIPIDGECNWVYNICHGITLLLYADSWVKRWIHWGGIGATLRRDVAAYVDMPFIRWPEKKNYESSLAQIVRNDSESTDAAPVTPSLEYITFPSPYDLLHLLTNFERWWMEIRFVQLFCVRRHTELFGIGHFVDIFRIFTHDPEKRFVRIPWRLPDYEGRRLLVAPMTMVFVYHSTFALHAERLSLLFCIAVGKHCVFILLSFFRLHLFVLQLSTFQRLRVPRLLRSRVFCFQHRLVCTPLWLISDHFCIAGLPV